jgi:inhibitor of the pro-sigma K processing machinery
MITEIILLIILIIIASITFKFIWDISSTVLKIAAHFIAGWILLTIVNILPGINVPINIITLIISGFGGVMGTVLLAIFYLLF